MKRLLLFLLLFSSYYSQGQNYACLQAGVKRYFTNSYGYLRGMRIDSVRTSGSDTIYYPFHTARGKYLGSSSAPLDSNGGSWLGKKVIQTTDGTFLFDNLWNDTLVIKTQGNIGDTWIFYSDTTVHYYIATVIANDTITIAGFTDSAKTIRINAYNASGIDLTDSANNLQIKLSKSHGFVSVPDLYTFPYHNPDTSFVPGADYYLDYITNRIFSLASAHPVRRSVSFTLASFVNPAYTQLYDWNVGDVFEIRTFNSLYPNDGTYPYGYFYDSIVGKTTFPGGTQFTYTGWKAVQHLPWGTIIPSIQYPYDTLANSGILIQTNDLLFDTTRMPEEKNQAFLQYFFPNDTSNCFQSDAYRFAISYVQDYIFGFTGEGGGPFITYKTGIGLVNYDWNYLGGSPPLINDTTLIYFVKSGVECGNYVYPSPINYLAGVNDPNKSTVTITPNPATTELTIRTNNTLPHTITLLNTIGQTITTLHSSKQEETIDVSDIPAALYLITVTDDNGNRYSEKIVVIH